MFCNFSPLMVNWPDASTQLTEPHGQESLPKSAWPLGKDMVYKGWITYNEFLWCGFLIFVGLEFHALTYTCTHIFPHKKGPVTSLVHWWWVWFHWWLQQRKGWGSALGWKWYHYHLMISGIAPMQWRSGCEVIKRGHDIFFLARRKLRRPPFLLRPSLVFKHWHFPYAWAVLMLRFADRSFTLSHPFRRQIHLRDDLRFMVFPTCANASKLSKQ